MIEFLIIGLVCLFIGFCCIEIWILMKNICCDKGEIEMQKVYHMIVQRIGDTTGKTRSEYLSIHQGSAPKGWVCVSVCGYHEIPKRKGD